MLILERADDFHRHVDGCVVCTAGCREAIFCVRGWRLLMSAANEAFELLERGVAADLAPERELVAESPHPAPTQALVKRPRAPRKVRENGMHRALNRAGVRLGTVPADAEENAAEELPS